MSFLDHLTQQGFISEADANAITEEIGQTGGTVDGALVRYGLTKDQVLQQKAKYLNIPIRKLTTKAVAQDALDLIPQESAEHYKIAPIALVDGVLEVGVVDPDNIEARDALQFISSRTQTPFKIFLISPKDFDDLMQNYQGMSTKVGDALDEYKMAEAGPMTGGGGKKKADEKAPSEEKIVDLNSDEFKPTGGLSAAVTEDAPISKVVGVILQYAVEGNASDVHIEHLGEKVRVRFRIDGVLYTSLILPVNVFDAVIARVKVLSNLKLDEKRKPQDGRFSATLGERKIDFRVSTFPAYYGEKIVMRILDPEKNKKGLDTVGFNPEQMAKVRAALGKPYGIILLTGPTGSGKTTTLYAMLGELDRETKNVVSLEDPVEYNIAGVSQSQVRPEIGYTFANGLRSILRQDPDIILVGEIRDGETAKLAIQAALTGHLVLSTIHTNTAAGAIPRLIDMGVDPYLIAPTLIMSIGQRLSRTLCPTSKKELPIDGAIKQLIDKQFSDLPDEFKKKLPKITKLYEAQPSAECPSGTKGRIGVFEILEVDRDIERTILEKPVEPEITAVARKKGMTYIKEDALMKSAQGLIPFSEVNEY